MGFGLDLMPAGPTGQRILHSELGLRMFISRKDDASGIGFRTFGRRSCDRQRPLKQSDQTRTGSSNHGSSRDRKTTVTNKTRIASFCMQRYHRHRQTAIQFDFELVAVYWHRHLVLMATVATDPTHKTLTVQHVPDVIHVATRSPFSKLLNYRSLL